MRHHQWAQNLTEYLVQLRYEMDIGTRVFTYDPAVEGAINCLIFADEVLHTLDPEWPPFPQLTSGYNSALSAARRIREEGVTDLGELLAKYFPEKPVVYAHRGDLLLVPVSDDPHFGSGVAIAEPPLFWSVVEEGLGFGDLHRATRCFGVHSHIIGGGQHVPWNGLGPEQPDCPHMQPDPTPPPVVVPLPPPEVVEGDV